MQQVAEQCIVGVGVDIFRHFQVSSALVPDQSCYSFQIGNSARYILRSFDQCGVFRVTNAKEMTIFDLSLGHLLSAPRKDEWLAEQQMAIAEHTALCGEHCDVVLHPNESFSKGFINILAIVQCDVVFWPFVIADGPALFPEMVKPVLVRCKCLRCLVGLTNALHIGMEHDFHALEISNRGIEPPQGRGRGGSVDVTFRRVGPVG